MGKFDIMLHVRQLMMFGLAMLIGLLFDYMAVPIPFLLGGIVSSMFWKVIGAQVYWPRQGRTWPVRCWLRHWAQFQCRNRTRTYHAVIRRY